MYTFLKMHMHNTLFTAVGVADYDELIKNYISKKIDSHAYICVSKIAHKQKSRFENNDKWGLKYRKWWEDSKSGHKIQIEENLTPFWLKKL